MRNKSIVLLLSCIIMSASAQFNYVKLGSVKFDTTNSLPSVIYKSPYKDTLVYVGSNSTKGFLAVISIADPYKPKVLQYLSGLSTDTIRVRNMFFKDANTLYTVGAKGVHVFTVSGNGLLTLNKRIASFTRGSTVLRPFSYNPAIAIVGNMMYLSDFSFYAVDISGSTAIETDNLSYTGVGTGDVIVVNNNTIIASDGYSILKIDVTNKADIKRTTIMGAGDANGHYYDAKSGNVFAALSNFLGSDSWLKIVNLSSGNTIDSLHDNSIKTTSMSLSNPVLINDTLYMHNYNELLIFEASNHSNIQYRNTITNLPASGVSMADRKAIYHANASLGFSVFAKDSSVFPTYAVEGKIVPRMFALHQNYPNPFNPTTTIRFGLPEASSVTLIIYDELGREISTLVNDRLSAGNYDYQWNALRNSSGLYFCRLTAQSLNSTKIQVFSDVKKLLLVK